MSSENAKDRAAGRKPKAPRAPRSSADSGTSKGGQSRATILHTAAMLATIRGLDALSIGDLAAEVGMSKSGLYAHFKSKEELELATIDTAAAIFKTEVIEAALGAPAGVARVLALADAFLDHLKRRVFPGGCFFAAVAMELGKRPGPAREKVVQVTEQWLGLLKQCLLDAREKGEIAARANVDQAVFEIEAMLLAGNFLFIISNDKTALKNARAGVENVVGRLKG